MQLKAVAVLSTVVVIGGTLAGCKPADMNSTSAVNQADLCEVSEWQGEAVAKSCKPGQKVAFLPGRFGNEQLPIIFAAVNCDLRHTVVSSPGGVTCIYAPITLKPASQEAPAAASPDDEK